MQPTDQKPETPFHDGKMKPDSNFREMQSNIAEANQIDRDLHNLLLATESAALLLDPELRLKLYTPRSADLFNLMPTDRGRPIRHLCSSLRYESLAADAHQVLDNLVPIQCEVQNEHGRWFMMSLRPYQVIENRSDGVVITFVDITNKKETEEALRQREAQYRTLFESINEGFCVFEMLFDASGEPIDYRWLETNPAFERHTGLVNAVGRTARELVPGLEHHWVEVYGRVAMTGRPEYFVMESAAMGRWFEVDAFRIGDLAERKVALLFTDITKRKQAEGALRKSQESLEVALDAAKMGTWDFDLNTHQARTNLRHNQIFGYTEPLDAWNLARFLAHILPEDRPTFQAAYKDAIKTGEFNLELRIQWTDGTVCWVHSQGRVYYDKEGKPVRIAGVTVDVTEQKEAHMAELRKRILQAQELERTQLAHEIHDGPVQELAALTFEIGALSARLKDESLKTGLTEIATKLGHNIRLLRHIMTTLRPPAVVSFGLATAIERHVEDLRLQQPKLAIELELDEEPPVLPEEIILALYRICQQALYNVVQHAEAEQVWVRLHSDGNLLVLEVEDNGVGFTIPEQLVELSRRKHLGILGMMERATAISGHLTVKSQPGEGTTISVSVPQRIK
jgi:PAS domain S-box-containing protein